MDQKTKYTEKEVACMENVLKAVKHTFSTSFDELHVNKLTPEQQQNINNNLNKETCADCPYSGICPYVEDISDDTELLQSILAENKEKPEENPNDFMVKKAKEDQQLVFGWANISVNADGTLPFDWQGDIKTPETLEKAAYDYVLKYRGTGEMHQGEVKGQLVESVMFTKEKMRAMGIPEGIVPEGWWVGFHIADKQVFNKIKNGQYQMFSIQGKSKRIPLKTEGGE